MLIGQSYIEPPSYIGDISNATLYEAYVNANKDNLDNVAIYTMDGKIYRHRELCRMIDSAAIGFRNMGIREGDKIGILINNVIEETVSLLALNRLNAISVFVDISKGVSDIGASVSKHNLKILIMEERMLPIETSINVCDIPVVFVGDKKTYEKGIAFSELLNCEGELGPITKNKENSTIIINSSGTTGIPKPIVHTNASVNAAAYKILATDYSQNRENIIMKVIPSYIGLGLITTLYTSLLSGTKIVLINGNNPQESIENTTKFILSFPEFRNSVGLMEDAKLLVFAAPMFFRVLAEKISDCSDLSYIQTMLAAGSKMGKEELHNIHSKLEKVNCYTKICNGYGQNEMCGAVTLNSNAANKEGSAGFPVIGTDICIVEPDSLEKLDVYQEGLILEKSESVFLRYENMPDETQKAFVTLNDGKKWFNTKDIGYLDEDNFLYITGRMSRVLVKYDCKISIDSVEEKIKNHPDVCDCAIIVSDKNEVEEYAIAFIALKSEVRHITEKVLLDIKSAEFGLSELEIPESFVFVSQIPYMENGKVDYRALEEVENNARKGEE